MRSRSNGCALELRRVLRGCEPEIESIARWTSRPATITLQRVTILSPALPAPPESVNHITALDVIEHLQDEEAWLLALVQLLAPGGEIVIRVPAEGPMAWLDALNIYRYITEFASRGRAPHETKPTGWHRHYGRDEIISLVERFGLRVSAISQVSAPLAELPHLVGLVTGDLIRANRETESHLVERRNAFDRKDQTRSVGKLGARWRATAIKPAGRD